MDPATEILERETFIPITQVSKLIPSQPNYSTVRRWRTDGLRAMNGQMCFLETRKIGGKRFVSLKALKAFLNAINEE